MVDNFGRELIRWQAKKCLDISHRNEEEKQIHDKKSNSFQNIF